MPLPLQVRLLRVLAEGEFFRVGGRELIRVDVRVIAATHQPLQALVDDGRFRADLLHRLDVVRLALPPLRERREDIPELAAGFLEAAGRKLGVGTRRLSADALRELQQRDWPGNVRELENLCWRLAALAPDETVTAADLAPIGGAGPHAGDARTTGLGSAWESGLADWARARLQSGAGDLHAEARERMEQVLFETALEHTGGHRGEAAAKLGLGRNTLTRKLGPGRKRR
jgi:two-component system nitrogen regulation response regulator GlnG